MLWEDEQLVTLASKDKYVQRQRNKSLALIVYRSSKLNEIASAGGIKAYKYSSLLTFTNGLKQKIILNNYSLFNRKCYHTTAER